VARAAHHDDVGFEPRGQFTFFRERREIVFGRDQ
jgi:hypothetical protein